MPPTADQAKQVMDALHQKVAPSRLTGAGGGRAMFFFGDVISGMK